MLIILPVAGTVALFWKVSVSGSVNHYEWVIHKLGLACQKSYSGMLIEKFLICLFMRLTHLILFIAGVIAITVSVIDILSSHVIKASGGFEKIAIHTLIYFFIGVSGIILVVIALARHGKNRRFRKEVEDFY